MMIVAQQDDITLWDLETAVFESIPSADKKLVVLPDTSHMTLYSNLTALDLAARAAGCGSPSIWRNSPPSPAGSRSSRRVVRIRTPVGRPDRSPAGGHWRDVVIDATSRRRSGTCPTPSP